eukprot:TRINITY_DN22410_c0_g1_i1.p1 TRINITY_DN22410_c0_g1~~TRINITY_DN22410_c0_g1_i1.p1  ORF type:complete len:594 (-),score=100.77 TRINITY_DN22410_c0_g1_i1:258-2039(-)
MSGSRLVSVPAQALCEKNTFIDIVSSGTTTPSARAAYRTCPDFGPIADGQSDASDCDVTERSSPSERQYPTLLPVNQQMDSPSQPASQRAVEVKRTFIEVSEVVASDTEDASPCVASRRTRTCPAEKCGVALDDLSCEHEDSGAKRRVGFAISDDEASDSSPASGRAARLRDYSTEALREAMYEKGVSETHVQSPVQHPGGDPQCLREQTDSEDEKCQQVRRRWNRSERRKQCTTEDLREEMLDAQVPGPGDCGMRTDRDVSSSPEARQASVPPFSRLPQASLTPGGAPPPNFALSALQSAMEWQCAAAAAAAAESAATAKARAAAAMYYNVAAQCYATPMPMQHFVPGIGYAPYPPAMMLPAPVAPPPPSHHVDLMPVPPAGDAAASVAGSPARGSSSPVSSPTLGATRPEAALSTSAGERPRGKRPLRLWAHIYLHMQRPGFDLVPMLIGRGGQNLRKIADQTGAKLRVRGRGSGHLEVDGKYEAPTPLMVAVTTELKDRDGFRSAIELTLQELRGVERRFRDFLEKGGDASGEPFVGPCFSIGLLTDGAAELLDGVLDGVPTAEPKKGDVQNRGAKGSRGGGASSSAVAR